MSSKEEVMKARSKRSGLKAALLMWSIIVPLILVAEIGWGSPLRELNEESGGTRIGVVYHSAYQSHYVPGGGSDCLADECREAFRRLSIARRFTLVEAVGDSLFCDPVRAVDCLIAQGVDAIVFYFSEPSSIACAVSAAHAANVPIVLCGPCNPPIEVHAPLVGRDVYHIGIRLGEQTGRLFERRFPGRQPKLLIVDSRSDTKDVDLEAGFVEGVMKYAPDLYIDRVSVDSDYLTEDLQIVVSLSLRDAPDLNMFLGTSDARAAAIVLALRNCGRGTLETEVVAGYGGSGVALQELARADGPWKVEAGLRPADCARTAYETVEKLLSRQIPSDSTDRRLLEVCYLVEPSSGEIQAYLSH